MFVHAACEGLVAHSHALLGEHGLHWFEPLWSHGFRPERLAFDRGFARPLVLGPGAPLWLERDLFRISPIVLRADTWIDGTPWASTYRATRITVAGERGHVMVRLPAVMNAGRELLAREQDLLARFSHPNLMRVLEVGQHPDGIALVLPPCAGRLELGIAPAAAARIGVELASAIGEVHRCGVVHGRISLASIWSDERGPVIDGFATAACDVEQIEYDDLTWDWDPEYWRCISPQQAQGEDPTAAADVWAVAMVVAALALGEHPMAGVDPFATRTRFGDPAFRQVDPATPLGRVLAGVLVADAARRPSPALLADYFARAANA